MQYHSKTLLGGYVWYFREVDAVYGTLLRGALVQAMDGRGVNRHSRDPVLVTQRIVKGGLSLRRGSKRASER